MLVVLESDGSIGRRIPERRKVDKYGVKVAESDPMRSAIYPKRERDKEKGIQRGRAVLGI